MKFLSDRIINLLHWSVKFGSFFNLIPFEWNSKSKCFQIQNDRKRIQFYITVTFYFLHQLFLISSYVRSIRNRNLSFTSYVLQYTYVLLYVILSAILVSYVVNSKDWLRFINRQVQFFTSLQAKHCCDVENDDKPKWQLQAELTELCMTGIALTQPVAFLGFILRRPDSEIFLTSIFIPRNNWITVLSITVPVNFAICFIAWSGILFVFNVITTFIFTMTGFLSELKFCQRKTFTKDTLRVPSEVIYNYRLSQILLIDFNSITETFLIVVLNDLVIGVTVMSAFFLIRFHHALNVLADIMLVGGSMAGIIFLLLTHVKFGEVNELSRRTLRSWRQGRQKDAEERRLVRRYIRSCRDLRIHMGGFGYYQKPHSLRIVWKLCYYTGKFLILTKPFT